jgi:hypothetical protein
MTPEETAAAVQVPISALGSKYLRNRHTRDRGQELGLDGWDFYVAGRCGVLGDVDADVVSAAMVFFPVDWVRARWESAREVLDPAETAAHYIAAGHAWGRERLAGAEGLERLAELAWRVAAAADPAGLSLFAGWRCLPLPDDAPARVAQLCMALREHRGNAHGIAVLAHGLRPLEAVLAGPEGADNARFFGWPEPYPDPEPLRSRWAAAEEATARLSARAYEVLDEAERVELARLLAAAARVALAR